MELSAMDGLVPGGATQPDGAAADRMAQLRDVSQKLEASFLSEMLKHAGVASPSQAFGGGPGEEAFSGFLVQAYGDALAERGGIGLAETIFQALVAREDRT